MRKLYKQLGIKVIIPIIAFDSLTAACAQDIEFCAEILDPSLAEKILGKYCGVEGYD